jgi:hypothetical protein
MAQGHLTVEDIADARAYERERDDFRARIIALKKIRRVGVGPVVSLVFENRDTIRFQIQEMARAERLYSDDAIQIELNTYNPLLPGPGRLSASLFIELTSRQEMEKWLPSLVGVERSVRLVIGEGADADVVAADVDEAHAGNLSRDEVTAAVHFVSFSLTPAHVSRFQRGPVAVAIHHRSYQEMSVLSSDTRASLVKDLLG